MDEELPFDISPEAHLDLLTCLTHTQAVRDRAHIPQKDLTLPTLVWSLGSTVDGINIGPEIALGHYSEPPAEAGSCFLISGHRIWIGERTLALLRGRTLVLQRRTIPAPISTVHCLWIEPEAGEVQAR